MGILCLENLNLDRILHPLNFDFSEKKFSTVFIYLDK